MKPLRLTVAGLNSFKEEQDIDFTYLCDGNVFGIFGPTGSGKSTLIDAITLALYGRVERAPGKVQGVVNKGTDSASVTFEFELKGADSVKRYRVERKYVAKDENTSCRLARISELTAEGAMVLADKVSHVDAKVEEILGLTVDDFTRAVVLPQGKFAEFLSLKGAERREMLERIFNLGDYGERLLNLSSTQHKEAEAAVRSVQSEQAGLGDASSHAVESAQAALEQSIREVAASLQDLNSLLAEKEKARVVLELQQELLKVERDLAVLDGLQQEMSELRHKVEQLTAAETVAPQVRMYEESLAVHVQVVEKLCMAQDLFHTHTAIEQEHATQYHKAASARSEHEPILTAELSELRRAIGMESRLAELNVTQARESAFMNHLQVTIQTLKAQSEDNVLRERTAVESLSVLSRELGLCVISPEERAGLEKATLSESSWKQALTQGQEITAELNQKQAARTSAHNTLVDAKERSRAAKGEHEQSLVLCQELESNMPPEISAQMRETASSQRIVLQQLKALAAEQERVVLRRETARQKLLQLEGARSSQEKRLSDLRLQSAVVDQQMVAAEAALEQAKQQSMAEQLAARLVHGESCPVCGSTEHPAPHHAKEACDFTNLELGLTQLKDTKARTAQEIAAIEAVNAANSKEYSEQALSLQEIDRELQRLQQERDYTLGSFPEDWATLPIMDLEQKISAYAQGIENALEARQAWATKLEDTRRKERTLRDKLGMVQQALALAEQHTLALESDVEGLLSKLKRAEDKELELRLIFDRDLLELGTEDLHGYKAIATGKDRRHRELLQTQKELEQKRAELEQGNRELERKIAAEQETLAVQTLKVAQLGTQVSELSQELMLITAMRPAQSLCKEVEQRITKLKEAETECLAKLNQARVLLDESGREVAACEAALKAAEVSRERALLQMERALELAGFASQELASEALKSLPYKLQWQQELQEYMERRAVAGAQAAKLRTQLAGRAITTSEWEHLEHNCLLQKQKYDNALQQRGQTEARLLDVRERNKRYEELEVQRKELAQHRDMLQEILSLLRGNALVEFMASEHLHAIAGAATEWLRVLTSHRYALEVDPDGGFVIRDDANGGQKRPVHTLSGGETFVASLALALALSAQIQLRGRFPLEFFFLDEGFGTLDPDLLETVMSCLERMQGQSMSIGIISHVPELRERIQRKVIVTSAERGGKGSRLRVI